MKLTSLLIATAVLATPSVTFAQSSPSPNNQSGPGISPTVQSPTDPGAAQTGNSKGIPERSTTNGAGTTGAGSMGSISKGEMKGTTSGPGTTPADRDPTGTRAPDNAK